MPYPRLITMGSSSYVLGCDLTQAGLSLVIVAGDGTLIQTLRRAYAGESAGPDAGQDPLDWWRTARTGIKEVLRRAKLTANQIRAIGITGDDATVLIDREGKVLAPAPLGSDPRAFAALEGLSRQVGARTLLNLAGGVPHGAATIAKLMVARAHEKRAWHDLHQVLAAKDFLRFKLTGTLATDATDAAASLLFNPKTRTWSKQLQTLLDVHPEWFPTVADGRSLSGRVTESAARDAGLIAGTPVVAGAGHPAAVALACGVHAPGTLVVELGGRGDVLMTTADAVRDPSGRLATTCHTVPTTWGLHGRDVAGSTGIDWLLDTALANEAAQARRNAKDPLEPLCDLASEVPPGADGLICLPGSGSSVGSLHNIDRRHGRGHMARAVLEGGALSCRRIVAQLTELKRAPEHVMVAGPGAASKLWCQILADVLDRDVISHPTAESAAMGAALLATVGVGVNKSVDDACTRFAKHKHTFHPRRAAADTYRTIAPGVDRLADTLRLPPALGATAASDAVAS